MQLVGQVREKTCQIKIKLESVMRDLYDRGRSTLGTLKEQLVKVEHLNFMLGGMKALKGMFVGNGNMGLHVKYSLDEQEVKTCPNFAGLLTTTLQTVKTITIYN